MSDVSRFHRPPRRLGRDEVREDRCPWVEPVATICTRNAQFSSALFPPQLNSLCYAPCTVLPAISHMDLVAPTPPSSRTPKREKTILYFYSEKKERERENYTTTTTAAPSTVQPGSHGHQGRGRDGREERERDELGVLVLAVAELAARRGAALHHPATRIVGLRAPALGSWPCQPRQVLSSASCCRWPLASSAGRDPVCATARAPPLAWVGGFGSCGVAVASRAAPLLSRPGWVAAPILIEEAVVPPSA
jgi:hypothetical protein